MENHGADMTGPAMTLPGRWARQKADMKKHYHGLFCLSDDYEADVSGGPAKGIASALIVVLETAMPMLHYGYDAWESVKYPTEYEGLKRIIVDSATNHNFKYWSDAAEQQMEKANPPWAPHKRALLQASINALRQLRVLYYGTGEILPRSYYYLRKIMADTVLYYLDPLGDPGNWTVANFEQEALLVAKAAYVEWKKNHKLTILDEDSQYIYKTMTNGFFRRSREKAIQLGRLEDPVPDSSDDESQDYDKPQIPFIFKPLSKPQCHIPVLMPPGIGFLHSPQHGAWLKKPELADISSNQSHEEVQQSSVHDNEFGSAFYDVGDEGYTVCSIQP
ncbi:unnamed protein product [Calypogeia fissa]